MQPESHKVTETPETAPDSALPNSASAIESAVEIGTHFFEQRYLYAFASRAEVAQYIRTQAIPDESKSVETVLSDWENLQPRVHQLVQREAGLADTMHVADVPEECEPLLRRYAADTLFRRSFVGLPISFGIVEIDKLVAAQRTVNLDYVARLRKKFSQKPTLAELLEICVAPTRAMDPVQHLEIAPTVHVFSSPNSDIRFLGSFLKEITPEEVDAAAVGGLPVAAVIDFFFRKSRSSHGVGEGLPVDLRFRAFRARN